MRWLVLVCVAVALLVMANRAAAARPIDVTITPQPVTAYGVYTIGACNVRRNSEVWVYISGPNYPDGTTYRVGDVRVSDNDGCVSWTDTAGEPGVYTYVYSAYIGKDNGRMIGNGLFEVVP
jgi:hypothetical protein